MKKILLAFVLSFGLVIGIAAYTPTAVYADTETASTQEKDDIHAEAKEFADDDVPSEFSQKSKKNRVGASNSTKGDTYWDQFSGHVFYDQLSSNEKSLYDKLKNLADSYLTGTGSATSRTLSDGSRGYYTPTVNYTGMDYNEAFEVVTIFCFENPQFYFLTDGIGYTESYDNDFWDIHEPGTVSLAVYPRYASGSARSSYTQQYRSAIESYIKGASVYKSDLAKETYFHDTLASTISYNQSTNDYNEDSTESQSASSAFLMKNTVCAGFSKAFSLLLNSQGIENVTITSNTHAWNEVRINGTWYVTDVTWDQNNWPSHTYFNISETELRAGDQMTSYSSDSFWGFSSEWVHTPLSFYSGIRPVCPTSHTSSVNAIDLNDVTQRTDYNSENDSASGDSGSSSDNGSSSSGNSSSGSTDTGTTDSGNTSTDTNGGTSDSGDNGTDENNNTSTVITPDPQEIVKKKPVKPNYFRVKHIKKGTIRLTVRTSKKVTGYYIYYRLKGEKVWDTKYVKVNGKSKTFSMSGLSKEKTYQLRAFSINSEGTLSTGTKTRTVKA